MNWPWNRRRRPAPRTASISDDQGARIGTLVYHDDKFRSRASFSAEAWQDEILGYVDTGPGVAGWLVDQVAKLLGLAPILIEEFDATNGDWVRSEYGPAYRIMGRVRTRDGDIHDLIETIASNLEAVAETHTWLDEDPRHGWVYGTSTPDQIERQGPDRVIIRERPGAVVGDPEFRIVPLSNVVTYIWGSRRYPAVPGNQMRRSLPDLRAYQKATRAVERAFDSRLISAGIIGMEFPPGTPQSVAESMVSTYEAWARRGFKEDDSLAAHSPFIAIGPKITSADVGHDVALSNIDAATMLLRQWARSFDLPTDWIVNGPGQGKFANEALTREEVLVGSVEPRERRIMGMVTETIFRPWARIMSAFSRDPEMFRVRLDIGALATPEDKTTDTIAIADRIGVKRLVLARQVGLTEEDLIELPAGVTEADMWKASLDRAAAPADPATSPTGRGPGQGIQAALGPAVADDSEVVDAVIVPNDTEIDGWRVDDDLQPRGNRFLDRFRKPAVQQQLLALQGERKARPVEFQLLFVPLGHADHHVGDDRPRQAVQRPVVPLVARPLHHNQALALIEGHLHLAVERPGEFALRPLDLDGAALEGHLDLLGHSNRFVAYSGHLVLLVLRSRAVTRSCKATRRPRASAGPAGR